MSLASRLQDLGRLLLGPLAGARWSVLWVAPDSGLSPRAGTLTAVRAGVCIRIVAATLTGQRGTGRPRASGAR